MRALIRVLLAAVLGLALVALPLLIVHRSECRQGDTFEDQWTAEVPFQAEVRKGCRDPKSGAELLLELVQQRT